MRTYEISSPNAAQEYFNNSILGHVCMLLAETLGSLRRPNSGAGRPAAPEQARMQAQLAQAGAGPSAAPERARMQAQLPQAGWLDRLDRWFWRQEQKEREAYLAKARDVFDLERRLEALDRQGISRYY